MNSTSLSADIFSDYARTHDGRRSVEMTLREYLEGCRDDPTTGAQGGGLAALAAGRTASTCCGTSNGYHEPTVTCERSGMRPCCPAGRTHHRRMGPAGDPCGTGPRRGRTPHT